MVLLYHTQDLTHRIFLRETSEKYTKIVMDGAMKYLNHRPDGIPERIHSYMGTGQSWLPHYVESMGINAQGERFFTERSGYDTFFVCLTQLGEGSVRCNGQAYTLRAQDLLILDCMEAHYYCTKTPVWQFLWIHFKGYGCRELFRKVCPEGIFYLHLEQPEPIYTLYQQLVPLLMNQTVADDLRASELLGSFLHTVAGYALWGEAQRMPLPIERTVAYLQQHYQENISVGVLAERENYSVYHFTKLFARYTGQTPYQYILSLRLRGAQQMLVTTNYSVEEISRFNNFSSCSRFIAYFVKHFGVTPLQYRKNASIASL